MLRAYNVILCTLNIDVVLASEVLNHFESLTFGFKYTRAK